MKEFISVYNESNGFDLGQNEGPFENLYYQRKSNFWKNILQGKLETHFYFPVVSQ